MAIKQLRTFVDVIDAVCEQLKIQNTDTVTRDRIRRNINTAYDEICSFHNWDWLKQHRTFATEPYTAAGTATVTSGSVTVTLTQAITTSKKGYYFSTNNYNEIYRIAAHTGGSATITLQTPFTGTTGSAIPYRIWTDSIPLPVDCRETLEVRHQHRDKPLDNVGLMEFRRITSPSPKAEGYPVYYTTNDFVDPEPYETITSLPATVSRSSEGLIKTIIFGSSVATLLPVGQRIQVTGAGDYSYNVEAIVSYVSGTTMKYLATVPVTESTTADTTITVKAMSSESYVDRYKELMVFPSISDKRTTLHVDYLRMHPPLEDDSDEPLMPMQDRAALLYGALWLSYSRETDKDESDKYYNLMTARLSKLAAKTGDSPDKPLIQVSRAYLGAKRHPSGSRIGNVSGLMGVGGVGGGGGGASNVSGTANTVGVFDSTGFLVGSPTITTTELEFLNGAEGLTTVAVSAATLTTLASWDVATFNRIHLIWSWKSGSTYASGSIDLMSDGSTVHSAVTGPTDYGSPGVTFTSDVNSGNIRLRVTTTNGGNLKYAVVSKWAM